MDFTLVRNRPVATFFVLALALSWVLWVPAFTLVPDEFAMLAVVVGSFGPVLAGAIVTLAVGDDLRAWAGKILRWRRAPRWYLVALALPFVAGLAVVPVLLGTGGSITLDRLPPVWVFPLDFLFVLLMGGGNEEPGWRGFALPRLQAAHGPLAASGAIGAVWALWHAPLYLLSGGIYYGTSFAWFAVAVFAFAVLFTWLYNGVRGSVLLCMVMHASVNSFANIGPGIVDGATVPPMLVLAGAYCVAAVVVLGVAGRDLGYEPPERDEPRDASLLSAGP